MYVRATEPDAETGIRREVAAESAAQCGHRFPLGDRRAGAAGHRSLLHGTPAARWLAVPERVGPLLVVWTDWRVARRRAPASSSTPRISRISGRRSTCRLSFRRGPSMAGGSTTNGARSTAAWSMRECACASDRRGLKTPAPQERLCGARVLDGRVFSLWRPGLQTRANNQAITLTVFSGACYKPHMWNRLHLRRGRCAARNHSPSFSRRRTIALQNPPPPRRRPDAGRAAADRRNALVDVQRRR